MNLDLRHWAARRSDRIAVSIGSQRLSYGELESQVNRLANVFAVLGLVRGDHMAAMLSNSPFALVVAWAAWRSGLYYTPLPTTLTQVDAAHVVADCQARMVLVDGRFADLATGLRRRVPAVAHWLSQAASIADFAAVEAAMAQQADTPRDDESPGALMLYTSGTTGLPKGVWRPLPDAAYRGAPPFAADLIGLFHLDDGVRYLSTAPLYHAAPLRFALATTAAGGSVFGLAKFEAAAALDALRTLAITHSQWVPTMFQRLLQLPLQERRRFQAPAHAVALHAAAPCPVAIKSAMLEWWGPILLEYYSGTEGIGLTMLDSKEWLRRPGSVGRAVKGVAHVIDDAGNELAAGQVGRIYFSGVSPFQYFGDAQKTAARTHPLGWQTLGDIGHLDSEGYLYLTDRQDDMIISGGVNVYPQEIEAAILELGVVEDCAVVGVPDIEFGERPVVFVVATTHTKSQDLIDLVMAHCQQRLGRIKRPDHCIVVDSLPRTPTGKLLRRVLRSQWPGRPGQAPAELTR
jgi:long-chain acyl-CoA synthetase